VLALVQQAEEREQPLEGKVGDAADPERHPRNMSYMRSLAYPANDG
jgi:hypothetical protein